MKQEIANYQRVEKAIGYLTENFKAQPNLEEIAKMVHMSPFHFHRIFTEWVGISPKKFLQYITADYLKEKIKETTNMIEAAEIAGLSGQSRVHDLFVSVEGVSPHQFKMAGTDLEIFYGYHASPFGMCFIAVTDRGVCCLKFVDEEKNEMSSSIFLNDGILRSLHINPILHKRIFRKYLSLRKRILKIFS